MLKTEISRSGELTLFIDGKCIHSKYDPKAEADTFIKKQSFTDNPELFIVIGSGLGYLKKSLLKFYPTSKLLSIHMDRGIYNLADKTGEVWIYGEDSTLSGKLERFIPDFLISKTKLIKWLPCTECFPNRIKEIEKIIQQFFLERRGTIFTTGNFGRQWLKNIYDNYVYNKGLTTIEIINGPVLIAASGPTLTYSLDIIKKYRNRSILVALPSSLPALNRAKIRPDFLIHTDPGFWAREHLKHITDTSIPVIMPLTATFKSTLKNPIIYINQSTNIENRILDDRFLKIQPHGTVAGTAYIFFRRLTDSPIIFLGLDFCFDDVKEHTSPHSFDILYNNKENRFSGYLDLLYKKQQKVLVPVNDKKTTKTFLTYSGWFNDETRLANAFRYCPTEIATRGIIDIDSNRLHSLLSKSSKELVIHVIPMQGGSKSKRKIIRNLLLEILTLLNDFYTKIDSITSNGILELFSKTDLLLEVLQYTSYLEILELPHYYKTDILKSRSILNTIYNNSISSITDLLKKVDL